MYSKLIFTVDGEDIELKLHEVAKVADDLLTEIPVQKVKMYSPERLRDYLSNETELTLAYADKDGTLDLLPFLPFYFKPTLSPMQWLFVAKHFKDTYQSSARQGWWLLVADRLLLVRNEDVYQFYASDHSFIDDLIKKIKKMTSASLPYKDIELIWASISSSISSVGEKDEDTNGSGEDANEEANYIDEFISGSDEFIKRRYKNLKKLNRIISEVHKGKAAWKFRSSFSYGSETGEPYHEFAKSVTDYLSKFPVDYSRNLAAIARKIIQGEETTVDDDINFLPNLVTAWLIAEGARNPVSVLTSIMLLDMIENGFVAMRAGENTYTWNYALKHPLNDAYKLDSRVRTTDFYGVSVTPFEMGGSHPMAHEDSQRQGRSSDWTREKDNKKSLNIVRQKEGNLLLHWLYVHLYTPETPFAVKLVEVAESPLEFNPDLMTMHSLADVEEKIKKLQGTIRVKRAKKLDDKKDLEKLAAQVRLRKKRQLIEFLIKPLLLERMKTAANLYSNIQTNPEVLRILKNFYETFCLNKEEYDFDEEQVASDGNCMFKAILESANRVHRKTIPDTLNTVNKLRVWIAEELRSYRSKYLLQVSQSIRDILYQALENGGEFSGISEDFEIALQPMLVILRDHELHEKELLNDIKSTREKLALTESEADRERLEASLSKLRRKQQQTDNDSQRCFTTKVKNTIYQIYCQNLETESTWGSQFELEMLATVLKVRIEIYSDTTENDRNHFISKRVTGAAYTVPHAYTVNNEAYLTIHLLHTGRGHYNILNPTQYGLRHYYSSIRTPLLSKNVPVNQENLLLFLAKCNLIKNRYNSSQDQQKYDERFGLVVKRF